MILRFQHGNVNNEYQYNDQQLKIIDDCLDENQIRNLFAQTYKSCQTLKGRLPLDPVIGYKAHLLYFIKRDIVSFNELPDQVSQNNDYKAFCRCDGVCFTPGYLSLFRKNHLNAEMAAQLHQDILNIFKGLELQSNTNTPGNPLGNPLRIGIWDSVPMPSYSSPYKDTKHCGCQEPCNCPKSFSDKDATIGWQSERPNRKDKFLGYRKHTILLYDADKNQRLPIATTVAPANEADKEVIEDALKQCAGQIDILIVDQAIYDFEQIMEWHLTYHILVLVKPKTNAVLSDYSVSHTYAPCCPKADEPLMWSHLDSEDNVHIYSCTQSECFYAYDCPCQFEIPMSKHPALLGVFPAHTRGGRLLLSLRRLIEPEFGIQTLWSRLKRLPFRGLHNFKLLAQLIDTVHLLRKVVQYHSYSLVTPDGFT